MRHHQGFENMKTMITVMRDVWFNSPQRLATLYEDRAAIDQMIVTLYNDTFNGVFSNTFYGFAIFHQRLMTIFTKMVSARQQ